MAVDAASGHFAGTENAFPSAQEVESTAEDANSGDEDSVADNSEADSSEAEITDVDTSDADSDDGVVDTLGVFLCTQTPQKHNILGYTRLVLPHMIVCAGLARSLFSKCILHVVCGFPESKALCIIWWHAHR